MHIGECDTSGGRKKGNARNVSTLQWRVRYTVPPIGNATGRKIIGIIKGIGNYSRNVDGVRSVVEKCWKLMKDI